MPMKDVLMPVAKTSAGLRYTVRLLTTMAVYVLLVLVVASLFRGAHPPTGAMRYVLAVAPAVPLLLVIVWIGLYLWEEKDEFLRMQTMLTLLGGLGLTLAITTVWGFLQSFAGAPVFELWWIFPMFCAGMGLAKPLVSWWYR
jgi:hypothetical protein